MSRTIHDWLRHAREASDASEVARCLDAATALAEACHDWRALLAGLVSMERVDRARVALVADKTLEAAKAEREVWGFRDAAKARATLGDTNGAREALEACCATLLTPRTDVLGEAMALFGKSKRAHGYEWVLLGRGFVEVLADEEGRRACLRHGFDMALAEGDAGDRIDLATEWAKHVDRAEGIARLREAESLADDDAFRPWTFSNAWYAVDEIGEARRVLDAALARAKSSEDAIPIVKAWATHGEAADARRAWDRAMQAAGTLDEFLAVGEAAFDTALGDDAVRAAIVRAEALAKDDDARARVSSAYQAWLRDDAAAARVGPRGVRPEELRRASTALQGWDASASALFDRLRAMATPEVLESIAHADYGMDASKHLAALRDICDTGLVPRTLAWEPHEVLALTRWSEGEKTDHVARALSCVLLCMSPSDLDELVVNGPILAESCLALGGDLPELAERFFAWRAETEEPGMVGGERPIALLLLVVLHASAAPDDARLDDPCRALLEHSDPAGLAEEIAGSMRAALWRELVGASLAPLRSARPSVAQLLDALGM